MTLTDSGPLVALVDADESDHEACRLVLAALESPLVTSWPAFTEAMYLLARPDTRAGQDALWRLTLARRVEIASISRAVLVRSAQLMAKYTAPPMDLADATLIALAEERGDRRIFTLDSEFDRYRLHGRHHVNIIPG